MGNSNHIKSTTLSIGGTQAFLRWIAEKEPG